MHSRTISRRQAIKSTALLGSAFLNPFDILTKDRTQPKTILLVSGWQYHNIGDIAHTPGLLHLLNIYLPDTKVILWPGHEVRAIDEMLLKNFPDLTIVNGPVDENKGVSDEVKAAAYEADFMLHGSGPSIVGQKKVAWWKDTVKKPYGIYGVTTQHINDAYRNIINEASFIFTRETHSLDILKKEHLKCKTMYFGPDATFAMNLKDNSKALSFMDEHKLESKKFICVVPRLRKTPYYKIYPERGWTEMQIQEVNTLNDQHMDADFEKGRVAMIDWVRQTGNKVLVCPEMTYALDIMDALIDPLPTDVKEKVIKRDTYWLCDEAAAVYEHSFAVLSFECHSPIMAAYNRTPAFYLRQPEDTIKGQMWYDIGLDDWVFEIEVSTGNDISKQLMKVYDDYPQAQQYLEKAMDRVREVQYESMSQVRASIL